MQRITNPKPLLCVGGPFANERVLLECCNSGTLVFKAKGETGRYVYNVPRCYPPREAHYKWEPKQ